MDMDYKPNSHKYKEEQKNASERKKVEKVVTGKVKTKKKSEIRKFKDAFVPEDILPNIISNVLIPASKKMIFDVVDTLLFGDTRKQDRFSGSSYIPYRSYSYSSSDKRDNRSETRLRSGYYQDDIIVENRGEAEEVLERMDELLDTYGVVSVADLYDLVGKPTKYTDNKYGWTNLRNAEPIRIGDGYLLRLPKAGPIN